MARRSLIDQDEDATEINLSPMIDCIFILLIFFIVTTVFVEETGLQVAKPDAAAPWPLTTAMQEPTRHEESPGGSTNIAKAQCPVPPTSRRSHHPGRTRAVQKTHG